MSSKDSIPLEVEDYGEEEAFIKTVEDDILENKYSSEEETIRTLKSQTGLKFQQTNANDSQSIEDETPMTTTFSKDQRNREEPYSPERVRGSSQVKGSLAKTAVSILD